MTVEVNQRIGPIRFCFIIHANDEPRFIRAMEAAFSLWGGIYSPILPYYDVLPDEFRNEYEIHLETEQYYKNIIRNYDPDYVIYDLGIDENFIKKISGDRKCETIEKTLEAIVTNKSNSISVIDIAIHLQKKEFKYVRSDGLKIRMPVLTDGDLLLKAHLGIIESQVQSKLNDLFVGNETLEQSEVNWSTIKTFTSSGDVDLIELNTFKIKPWSDKPYLSGYALYFLRHDRLNDVINFWNFRAAGNLIVPIPVSELNIEYSKDLTKRFVEWSLTKTQGTISMVRIILSYNLSEEIANQILDRIRPNVSEYAREIHFGYQRWVPRYWESIECQESDQIKSHSYYCDIHFSHKESDDERLNFTTKKLSLDLNWEYLGEKVYRNVISLNPYDELAIYAPILADISSSQLTQLIQPGDFRKWRLSTGNLHRFQSKDEENIHITIPKSVDFFRFYFENKGYKMEETINARLAREILKNLGGIQGSSFYLNDSRLKIIQLFERGNDEVLGTLLGEIKKNKVVPEKNAKFFIKRLVENKVIEMGASVKCQVCGQHGFYSLKQIDDEMNCPICRNSFRIPIENTNEIQWAYRGIGPFSRNNKADGVFAVFATLNLFRNEFADFDGQMSASAGFLLTKSGRGATNPMEIDLGIILQNRKEDDRPPDLLFCECKTYKHFDEKDIERMTVLGDNFPGSVLCFATLNTELNAEESKIISKVVKHFQTGNSFGRPRNSILILTGKELLPKDFYDVFEDYKDQLKPYHKHGDFIGSLCELSIKKHLKILNWWDFSEAQRISENMKRNSMLVAIIEGVQKWIIAKSDLG